MFYSQFGEDIYVYNNFINKAVPDGKYVELGAMDGTTYSNTKFFEDNLHFSGVLIEPTESFDKLVLTRGKNACYNYAVNKEFGKAEFLGRGSSAGLKDSMNEDFRKIHHKNDNNYYMVECCPFSAILKNSEIKYIDFLSIDVEGSEQTVLETMDFSIPVYVIVIELDGHNPKKDQNCRNILMSNGFVYDRRINIDEYWVNPTYYRKDVLYDASVPKVDLRDVYSKNKIPYIDVKHEHIRELYDALLSGTTVV